jgi:hypothetical protein
MAFWTGLIWLRIIFKWFFKKYDGVLDWIDLAQDNVQMGLQEIRWRLGLD